MGGRRWSSGADRAHWFLSSLTPRERAREFNLNPYLFYLLDREGTARAEAALYHGRRQYSHSCWNIPAVALDPLRKLTYFTTEEQAAAHSHHTYIYISLLFLLSGLTSRHYFMAVASRRGLRGRNHRLEHRKEIYPPLQPNKPQMDPSDLNLI